MLLASKSATFSALINLVDTMLNDDPEIEEQAFRIAKRALKANTGLSHFHAPIYLEAEQSFIESTALIRAGIARPTELEQWPEKWCGNTKQHKRQPGAEKWLQKSTTNRALAIF